MSDAELSALSVVSQAELARVWALNEGYRARRLHAEQRGECESGTLFEPDEQSCPALYAVEKELKRRGLL